MHLPPKQLCDIQPEQIAVCEQIQFSPSWDLYNHELQLQANIESHVAECQWLNAEDLS